LKKTATSIAIIFTSCESPSGLALWQIIIIICGIGAFVIFAIIVMVTPLRYVIFPFLKETEARKSSLREQEEKAKRKTEITVVQSHLTTLIGEIDSVKLERDRVATLISDIDESEKEESS